MNTTEKLTKIRAKCVELLAIAEKRTPGKWEEFGDTAIYTKDWMIGNMTCYEYVDIDCPIIPKREQIANANFIASCAGPAEAGWEATIAAIDALIKERDSRAPFSEDAENGLRAIISAWEGIL